MKPSRRARPKFAHVPQSVSEGTTKTEDLFENFIWTLKQYKPRRAAELQREWDAIEKEEDEARESGKLGSVLDRCQEARDEMVNTTLVDELQELCPDYSYFGGHTSDMSDIGFWPDIEGINRAVQDDEIISVEDTGEIPTKYVGYVVHVNDHGNMTVYYKSRNHKLKEIWAVV